MSAKKYSKIFITMVSILVLFSFLLYGCQLLQEDSGEEAIETVQPEEEEQDEPAEEKTEEGQEEVEQGTGETSEPGDEEEGGPASENLEEADFFASAILRSYNPQDNTLIVEQLINEPNEKMIGPELKLAEDLEVIRSILIKMEDTEEEYQKQISMEQVPVGTEIGIKIENGKAAIIISQFFIDAANQSTIKEIDPENEFFINAILKSVEQGSIKIEQLINEPNETEVGPSLELAENFESYISVVVRQNSGEEEYINFIDLENIPLGSEVGIIVNEISKARAIIYSTAVN
jgi:hypothetical protein